MAVKFNYNMNLTIKFEDIIVYSDGDNCYIM